MTLDELPAFLTTEELAELLRVPLATVRDWRHRGQGPPGYRFGKHVRYSSEAVLRWAEQQADIDPRRRGIRITRLPRAAP